MIPGTRPVTISLIAICILVYLLSLLGMQESIMRALLISQYLGSRYIEIREGEIWRLITPVFLHFGLFHIVFNMLWTWEFGRIIEWQHGKTGMLGITLLIGVISNLFQYHETGPVFGGMSGVIYGYFGFLWIQGLINRNYPVKLNRSIVILLLGWFAVCWIGLIDWLLGVRVANTAHTAGLISGIVLAFAMNRVRMTKRPRFEKRP
ncbi:MAG: rhomboid family intramembrane serine protease [Gammaproteobacteria bacterium]|nr:rhomboid family intramembrane serine protease [Gammaproteobacteria bacterium]MCY4228048.1 rhomboid family intramembrane serine protease [Gammaproteobacteria bacterium]